jgi:hypothetical protein
MSPADCFATLWAIAERALYHEWRRIDPDGSEDDGTPIRYEHTEFGGGFERAGYINDLFPIIRLWTDRRPFPAPNNKPDPSAQPDLDACDLAHEYGHFLSGQRGHRSAAYMAAALKHERNEPLRPNEQSLIDTEEERAWTYAHAELEALGVTEWDVFNDRKMAALGSYRVAFAANVAPGGPQE